MVKINGLRMANISHFLKISMLSTNASNLCMGPIHLLAVMCTPPFLHNNVRMCDIFVGP